MQELCDQRTVHRLGSRDRRWRFTSSRVCGSGSSLKARTWYERLLGEPAFFPHATEADPDGNELDFGGTPVEAG